MPLKVRELIAELFGAFCIVFVGSGSIMMHARAASGSPLLAVSLSYALILAGVIASMSHLSTHFNPAITVGMMVARRTRPIDGLFRIVAQCVGAIVGAYALSGLFPEQLVRDSRVGGTTLASDVSFMHGVGLEAITTGILMLVVLGVIRNALRPGSAAVVVGFTVGALVMAIGPLTGASLNPARSLGPALASGIWEGHAVYWIGPIIGTTVAALLWMLVIDAGDRTAKAAP